MRDLTTFESPEAQENQIEPTIEYVENEVFLGAPVPAYGLDKQPIKPTNNWKEKLGDSIGGALMDGQNQIHDLRSNKATPDEITERMQASAKFHLDNAIELVQSIIKAQRTKDYASLVERIERCWRPLVPGEKEYLIGGISYGTHNNGYNSALQDILAIIKEQSNENRNI
jgi:hypothetical protein